MLSVLSPVRLVLVVCVFIAAGFAQTPASVQPANSDPTYQQLRNIGLGSESVTVSNFDLKRDAATFHLRSGTICFVSPVEGKVTGAVFIGEGSMSLVPPIPVENRMLKLLTREDTFNETFNRLVLRFTDSSYDELKKAGTPGGGCDAGPLKESQEDLRWKMHYNLTARILQDVLSTQPGGLFVAFIHGKRYEDKMLYTIDPHGVPGVLPEEVELSTYNNQMFGSWAAFHYSSEYKDGTASGAQKNALVHIADQQLDTTIEKNGNLIGKAATTFVSRVDGLRVVPFNLFQTLRVESVTGDGGQSLAFIQEDKREDADFSVILAKPLAKGEKYTVTTKYSGKEAVSDQGGGNYFPNPGARENWYPNSYNALGEYTTYDMEFRIPKGMKMAAAGNLVSEDNTGGQNVTEWKSEGPQTVAGFNFGRFKMQEVKMDKPKFLVQSYANEEPPDSIKSILHAVRNELPDQETPQPTMVDVEGRDPSQSSARELSMGTMSTVPLIKKSLAQGELAIQLYTDYYGPISLSRLALTQQTSCNFGQAWPSLVWLPMCSFYDTTVRQQLGLSDDRGYWKIVTPHEVAHEWWGHEVGFNSYRDQWMSEGFADMSAGLFLQMVEKNPKKFIQFWNEERELLLDHDKEGYRGIDMPVTMGYRADNSRSGTNLTRLLIYPKGAYILHMVRMMMWNNKTGDQDFKKTMQDFVSFYSGKAATTEDFKAILEKHMTPEMIAMAGNKNSMDWFFDEYVYGTALPTYKIEASFEDAGPGKVTFNFKLTQSGVDDTFRMLVPIYFEFANGRVVQLGRVRMTGNTTVSQQLPLPMNEKPKQAMVNYFDDVLATPN